MADSHSVFREPRDLRIVEVNAVRQPDPSVDPPHLLQIIERPTAVMVKAVIVLVTGFPQMGMEKTIMLLGERRGIHHQLPGDVEGRAWRQRDVQERAVAGS